MWRSGSFGPIAVLQYPRSQNAIKSSFHSRFLQFVHSMTISSSTIAAACKLDTNYNTMNYIRRYFKYIKIIRVSDSIHIVFPLELDHTINLHWQIPKMHRFWWAIENRNSTNAKKYGKICNSPFTRPNSPTRSYMKD